MEIKKSEKADLGNKRLLFVLIGFVLALAVVLFAFEKTSRDKKISTLQDVNQAILEEDDMINTMETPPPPPETIQPPVLSDQINIMDDNIEFDDNIINTEDDASMGVTIMEYHEGPAGDEEPEKLDEKPIDFVLVEKKPSFNGGGPEAFTKWIATKLNYPEIAKENGVQGRVILEFTVDKDGSVKNVHVLRGVDKSLDDEAVRVVSSSPKWTPGEQRDRKVKVKYTFPVIFQLR